MKLVTDNWLSAARESAKWFMLFAVLSVVVGAIIGSAWEIVAAIKQTRQPQPPSKESKEG